jgi:hypothetical protein
MAHGYECDRCGQFVEQGRGLTTPEGPPETVAVNPPTESRDEYRLNEYTLCERCRSELVSWIEDVDLGRSDDK